MLTTLSVISLDQGKGLARHPEAGGPTQETVRPAVAPWYGAVASALTAWAGRIGRMRLPFHVSRPRGVSADGR